VLAAIRPDSWNFPLLVHVLGAALLVGALVTAVSMQALGWARSTGADPPAYARLAFRTLLLVALPAWFVMRIGAEWIYSKEQWADAADEPGWLGFGYITADLGGLLLLTAIVLAGFGARRLVRAGSGSNTLARSATVLSVIVLALYLVALWAMTAKPS
jgi:hypothetical protein